MIKNIENIVSFPVNAQRNSFFGALSSILLYRNAYTEDTPFFSAANTNVTVYGAAAVETNLLSISTTFNYINI